MSDTNAPAGWYPDGQAQLRWWDGVAWTSHYAPLASAPVDDKLQAASAETSRTELELVAEKSSTGTPDQTSERRTEQTLVAETERQTAPQQAKTRNGRIVVDGDTVTFALRGKTRELSLHNIDAVTYEPPGAWRNGTFRLYVTGDISEPKNRYIDPWTIVLPGGPESMRDDWSDFYAWMDAAVAAAQPKTPLEQAAAEEIQVRVTVPKPAKEPKRAKVASAPATSDALAVPAAASKTTRELRHDARELKKATEQLQKRLASWRSDLSIAERALRFAMDERPSAAGAPVMLKAGETWWQSFPVQLIEDRVQTAWTSGHQGLSIPVAKIGGRSVRYSVGATKGHVDRTTVATPVDQGNLVVTSQRLLFLGQKQSRESLFSKLIGVDWPAPGQLAIAVTNRQKVTLFQYQPSNTFDLQMTVTVAQAEFSGRRDELIKELQHTVTQVRAAEPKLGG